MGKHIHTWGPKFEILENVSMKKCTLCDLEMVNEKQAFVRVGNTYTVIKNPSEYPL